MGWGLCKYDICNLNPHGRKYRARSVYVSHPMINSCILAVRRHELAHGPPSFETTRGSEITRRRRAIKPFLNTATDKMEDI